MTTATPQPMMRWPGADGLMLAADSWGDPRGPHVLLLHGGGQTRHAWRTTGQMLADAGYHAVAPDARGHGDSEWSPEARYHQDDFVHDLQSIVVALGDPRPVLIGASIGGNTCLAAAGEGHVDAAALVLVDIVPRTERAGFERTRGFMSLQLEGFASLEAAAVAIARFHGDGRPPRSAASLAKTLKRGDDGRFRWHWDPRFLEGRERDYAERGARLSACAKRLAVPTLLVRGGSSDVVSEDGAREFLSLAPHAEYVNVADAGHMLAGDSNTVFGRATLDFLARHVPIEKTA